MIEYNIPNEENILSVLIEPSPPGLQDSYKIICSKEAIEFTAELVSTFASRTEQLFLKRLKTKCIYQTLDQLPKFANSPQRKDQVWKVGPLPKRLLNRHLDLGDVSPANADHFKTSLLADVQGVQVDFDDGHCPTWTNQITGLHNIYKAVHGQMKDLPPLHKLPLLMLRPRAWNMIEHNMMVNGKHVPGPLFDFGFLIFHNAHKLLGEESGPFFYLSKLEGSSEAELWNDIFIWAQKKLQIPIGTIKACVLIENIISSFEMDEILYALKDHSLGLNCGIWDYAASIICKFGHKKCFMLPDRNKYVNMNRHFLKYYLYLVIQTCHKRGAHATGGMAPQLLHHANDSRNIEIIKAVCEGKLQEIVAGVDGFMVYDKQLIQHINELWKKHTPAINQLSVLPDVTVNPRDLLKVPSGGITIFGLKHNVEVTVLFIYNWFQGEGHFQYKGTVEDSATAEISRSQIWQWIRHKANLDDHTGVITKQLVDNFTNDFIMECCGTKPFCDSKTNLMKLKIAKQVFLELVTKSEFPDFITTYLNDNSFFTYFQKFSGLMLPKSSL